MFIVNKVRVRIKLLEEIVVSIFDIINVISWEIIRGIYFYYLIINCVNFFKVIVIYLVNIVII